MNKRTIKILALLSFIIIIFSACDFWKKPQAPKTIKVTFPEGSNALKMGYILEEKNISQSELAKNTNLSKSAITHYINGVNDPTPNNLKAIANYLKVSEEYLTGFNNIKESDSGLKIINNIIELTKGRVLKWESIDYLFDYPDYIDKKAGGIFFSKSNNYTFHLLIYYSIDKDEEFVLDENNDLIPRAIELYLNKNVFFNSMYAKYKEILLDLYHWVELSSSHINELEEFLIYTNDLKDLLEKD